MRAGLYKKSASCRKLEISLLVFWDLRNFIHHIFNMYLILLRDFTLGAYFNFQRKQRNEKDLFFLY